MFRLVVICGCLMAVANGGIISGGLIGATAPASIALQPSALALQTGTVALPSVASTSSNIIRGIGNLGAISAYSKSVDTAFSSERNGDIRINNPDVQTRVLSYAATAPALAVSGTALAAPLTVATGPALATTSLGLGLNGVAAVNGYGLGVNGYGLGVNGLGVSGYGLGVNGLGVNGYGLGLGHVKVL